MKTTLICKIFIQFDASSAALERIVEKLDLGGVEADVRVNSDFAPSRNLFPEDFQHFPFVLELFDDRDDADGRNATLVARLVDALVAKGASVVTACAWEELLPNRGQARSRSRPEPL